MRISSAPARASVADVIAIFGPTASGKSAVAEALAARIPARLISADAMQVYRGVPILTNQSDFPTELVGIWDLDHEASVGEYAELAHAAIDLRPRGGQDAGRRRRDRPLPPGGARRARLPPAPSPGNGSAGSVPTTSSAPRPRTRRWPSAIRRPPRSSTRTTVAGSSVRSSCGGRRFAGAARGAAVERGHAPPDAAHRSRGPDGRARAPDRGANEDDVRAWGGGRGASRPRGPDLLDRPLDPRSARSRRAAPRRSPRRARAPDAAVRRVPAQVDAADSGPC